jgi:hypothetical protein
VFQAQARTADPPLANVAALENLVAQNREDLISSAPMYPPGFSRFGYSCGTFSFEESGFTAMTGFAPPQTSFGVDVWMVRVAETNNMLVYSSGGVEFHSTTVPHYDKLAWSRTAYGEPPQWLSGDKLTKWYKERARERLELLLTLIPEDSLAEYNANRIAAAQANASPPYDGAPRVPSDTNRVAFAKVDVKNGALSFVLYSPVDAPIDVFSKTELKPGLWDYRGYAFASPQFGEGSVVAATPALFLHASRGDIDTDGDGIPDGVEKLSLGTSPYLWDSSGDLISDWFRLYNLGLGVGGIDTDGDGYTDAEEIARGTDPTVPQSGAGATIRYYYDTDDRLNAAYSGATGSAAASIVSPAGNHKAQYERK